MNNTSNNIQVDVVLGLARGDEGKGKICHSLLQDSLTKNSSPYTHCLRFSGGGNCGHTIYHNSKKFVTHLVPAGVFWGIRSVLGPGCVVDPNKLLREIEELEKQGIQAAKNLVVASNAHIVLSDHIVEDSADTTIGTTKTGNGPCYRDKYFRSGQRAEHVPALKEFLVDVHSEFYKSKNKVLVLAEGAQGFYLDIDWGDYPYVTSSHCGIGSVLLNGFSHKNIRNVVGVCKAYDTYVGNAIFQPKGEPLLYELQRLGKEFGATTGRPRQCKWLNLDELIKSLQMNGVNNLIMNKLDILEKLISWKAYYDNQVFEFSDIIVFKAWVKKVIYKHHFCDIAFSSTPLGI